jgi:glycosidase
MSHGYDTLDHYQVDARLGDGRDLDDLFAAARDRGLAVVLDGVFNHVGRAHPLVRQALAERLPAGGPVRAEVRNGLLRPRRWEGHGALVELNHDHQVVHDLVTDVMLHWLRRGAAGWRLDVAYAVPAAFWRDVLSTVRAEFPESFFLGEVIRGNYAEFAAAASLDSVTQYELWKAIRSSLVDRNFWELARALDRHDELSRDVVLQTFVGNHDVTRVATAVGDAGAALAATVLMTVPGLPSVYYGDEQAFHGAKGRGADADDAIRPPLPSRPDDLAEDGRWLCRLHRQLIGLRRRNAWLTRARLRVLGNDNSWIGYECTGGGHRLQVRLDVAGQPRAHVELDGAPCLDWPSRAR